MNTLIRNAFVVSMDPAIGNLDGADIRIEGGAIAAIGRGLDATGAAVIDATGHIAAPGFIDTHHHVWQSALRNWTGDWSLLDYVGGVRMMAAGWFEPDDLYAAEFHGLLAALNAGVTTTMDYCHCLLSPDHAEEALRGVRESGARVVWGYGFNHPPLPAPRLDGNAARIALLRDLAKRHFAARDALATLAVCPEEQGFWPDPEHGRAQFAVARELDARIFLHANSALTFSGAPARDAGQLAEAGQLGPDLTLVHMNFSERDEWNAVAASGAAVCFTPETELQMSMGFPSVAVAAELGIPFGLGVDIVSNNAADLRAQIRMLLAAERHRRRGDAVGRYAPGVPVSCRDALAWGTIGAARALGLDARIGSLAPGKAADIVLHDGRGLSMAGWTRSEPEAALLLQGGPESVATVLVGGRVVKRDGKIEGAERACALLERSSVRLQAEVERRGGTRAVIASGLAALADATHRVARERP